MQQLIKKAISELLVTEISAETMSLSVHLTFVALPHTYHHAWHKSRLSFCGYGYVSHMHFFLHLFIQYHNEIATLQVISAWLASYRVAEN